MSFSSPPPSTIVVFSFEIVATLDLPNQFVLNLSSFIPLSLENTSPPVKVAISSKINFFLSPNSGDFTAHTFNVPLILLTISVANASLSISSAITNNDLFSFEHSFNIGSNSFTEVNL